MAGKADLSTFERWLITIFSAFLFAVAGVVLTVVFDVVGWLPLGKPAHFGFPFSALLALLGGVLAWRYPRVFEVFLWFMP